MQKIFADETFESVKYCAMITDGAIIDVQLLICKQNTDSAASLSVTYFTTIDLRIFAGYRNYQTSKQLRLGKLISLHIDIKPFIVIETLCIFVCYLFPRSEL